MKTASEIICFQEVPDEISLSFSITNCPHKCRGCHSPWLREDCGEDLFWKMPQLIRKYKDQITCVLFMGGDDPKQIEQLKVALHYCRAKELKTALYSGEDDFITDQELLNLLDYVKIGSYQENLGGLKSPNTNQKFNKKIQGNWTDITYKFWSNDLLK